MGKKVGLFGGSFNPVHTGHLRAAEEIREMLLLDKVIFIPTYVHPLKQSKDIPDAKKRYQMLKLAIRDNPLFEASDVELKREGPSYTIDTLKYYSNKYKKTQFYFIFGTENLTKIDKWYQYQDLFKYSNFVVIKRPGVKYTSGKSIIPSKLRHKFRNIVSDNSITVYEHKSSKKLIFVNIRGIRISSTMVRKLIKEKRSVRYFIPDNLNSYILKNKLYVGE